MLNFDDLALWRDDQQVFAHLSFQLAAGQHTVILGPNGAGKSSLLKLITQEIYPLANQGSLSIFGKARWNLTELRQHIGLVSNDLQQNFSPQATGEQVVLSGYFSSLGTWAHQSYSANQRQRALQLLAEFDLSPLRLRPFAQMSTGQQRRCLLARALVQEPELLIFDEPTSGLDPAASQDYLSLLPQLAQQGKTLILVTHHLHEIPPFIDRVVLLQQGQIIADGSKQQLLTAERLSALFGRPLHLVEHQGYYQVLPLG